MMVAPPEDQSVEGKNSNLSRRELQCLAMAARGLTSDDMAYKLGISPRTIRFHFTSIYAKLAALNRQEAVAIAVKNRLIDF
jgi:DNA-binding CsgD family transcriptional regulator